MSKHAAARYLRTRMLTFWLYLLGIANGGMWDADPNNWVAITYRLIAGAAFLYWAVNRSIQHWHDDQAFEKAHQEKRLL